MTVSVEVLNSAAMDSWNITEYSTTVLLTRQLTRHPLAWTYWPFTIFEQQLENAKSSYHNHDYNNKLLFGLTEVLIGCLLRVPDHQNELFGLIIQIKYGLPYCVTCPSMSTDPGSLNPGMRRSRIPGWWDPGIRTNTGAGDTVLAKHT